RNRALDLAPTIQELQAAGCESLRAMAAGLEERGIPARRAVATGRLSKWHDCWRRLPSLSTQASGPPSCRSTLSRPLVWAGIVHQSLDPRPQSRGDECVMFPLLAGITLDTFRKNCDEHFDQRCNRRPILRVLQRPL